MKLVFSLQKVPDVRTIHEGNKVFVYERSEPGTGRYIHYYRQVTLTPGR